MWLSVTLTGRSSFGLDARGAADIAFGVSVVAIEAVAVLLIAAVAVAGPEPSTAVSRRGSLTSRLSSAVFNTSRSAVFKFRSAVFKIPRFAASRAFWLKFISLWILPHALPLSVVVSTVVFSQWMYAIGAEFSSSAITVVFMGLTVVRQLSYSWMHVAFAAFVIFTHHTVLVVCAMCHVQAGLVDRMNDTASYQAPNSQLFHAICTLAVVLRGVVLTIGTSRLDEREAREDFILDARTRHRRNVSQRVVEAMVPGPVANEMRSRMARGLPPSLSWKFDMICILQSDIVGFTRRACENRI